MCARQLRCDKIGIAQQDAPPPGGVPFGELAGEFAIGRIADGSELAGQLSSESGPEVKTKELGSRRQEPRDHRVGGRCFETECRLSGEERG